MISIPTVVGVMSCGFLLCLGLSLAALADNAALAADEMNAGQTADRKGGQAGIKDDQNKLKGDEINAGQSVDRTGGQARVKAGQDKLKKSTDQTESSSSKDDKRLEGDFAKSADPRNEKTGSMGQ